MKINKYSYKLNTNQRLLLLLLVIITFIVYSPVFNNQLNNWDDKQYIIDNSHIQLTVARTLNHHSYMESGMGCIFHYQVFLFLLIIIFQDIILCPTTLLTSFSSDNYYFGILVYMVAFILI